MNKSITFIKEKIAAGDMSDIFIRDGWDEAKILKPFDMLQVLLLKKIPLDAPDQLTVRFTAQTPAGNSGKVYVTVKYDPNAEFQYLATHQSKHDGTYAFIMMAVESILRDVIELRAISADAPSDFCEAPWLYDVLFEVGDIAVLDTYNVPVDFPDGRTVGMRTSVAMPVKVTYNRKEEAE